MQITEHFKQSGNWLFRWRSYLPLVLFAFASVSLRNFEYPDDNHQFDLVWEALALDVSLSGLAIRVYAIGCAPKRTSGRNTAKQVADELNTTGLYSVLRHPLYLGNTLIWLGIALFPRSFVLPALVMLVSWLYHERIIYAEEDFLEQKHGEAFRAWAKRTPAIWPKWSLWRRSALPFAWRHALKREYHGLFGIISAFFAFEIAGDWFVHRSFEIDPVWFALWFGSLIFYLATRFLRKLTSLLEVPGR